MTKETLRQENKETAEKILRLVNYMGNDEGLAQALSEVLLSEHRTLQQNFWRMIAVVANEYSEKVGTDLRNEASKEFAKKITQIEVHLPFV